MQWASAAVCLTLAMVEESLMFSDVVHGVESLRSTDSSQLGVKLGGGGASKLDS